MSDTMENEVNEEATEATEATDEAPAASKKGSRAGTMPTYGLEKIESGELPEDAPQGRNNLYVGLLKPLVELDPGDWYSVAYFKTPTGAKNALNAIEAKERPIPEGNWEFEARKVQNPQDVTGQKHSKLFARYMGE